LRNRFVPQTRPSTPSTDPSRPAATHALHPKQPIQTPQEFYDWFSLIDRSVAHSQDSHFRAHVASVAEHLETCDRLIHAIDEVENEVDGMLEGWKSVEDSGKSLKDACERLLLERVCLLPPILSYVSVTLPTQDRLTGLADNIDARLEYFQELGRITRTLNHPGESLVLQGDFLYMVERIDICIDYLKAHVSTNLFIASVYHTTLVDIAALQGGGGVLASVPTVYDPSNDTYPHILHQFFESSDP
jgi:hypothetical protein